MPEWFLTVLGYLLTPAIVIAFLNPLFSKRLQQHKHELDTLIENQRQQFGVLLENQKADLNVLVGRQARIDAKEFEVLAELWSKFVAATHQLAHMRALSTLWEREEFRNQKQWNQIFEASKATSTALREAQQQLLLVDIFIPQGVADELWSLSEMISDGMSKLDEACTLQDVADGELVPRPYSSHQMAEASAAVEAAMQKRIALKDALQQYLRRRRDTALTPTIHENEKTKATPDAHEQSQPDSEG